jgi:tRNA dimethylallyltransferase
LYLTGPTASGKTPLALELAERLRAEIVSLDSMAIYRGMDIGTAKPTAEDRARVPHHLLDIVAPNESYSLSCYVEAAHRVAGEIRARGNQVLFVGGTPLYLKALLRGLFLGPPANPEFRAAVEADVAQYGLESLRDRLSQVDPLSAHKLHLHDQRRMIRALEVAMATGRPLSHWQTQFETAGRNPNIRAAVIGLDRGWLHERINGRVDRMIGQGLIAEVEQLIAQYGPLSGTSGQAVGYKEVQSFLLNGAAAAGGASASVGSDAHDQVGMHAMLEEIKAHTRQFARRQEIWFRGMAELHRVEMRPETAPTDLIDQLMQVYSPSPS